MKLIETYDHLIFFWINNGWASPAMDGVMGFFTIAGDASVWIIFGLLSIFFYGGSNRRHLFKMFIFVIVVAGISVQSAKSAVGRDRPVAKFENVKLENDLKVKTPLNILKARSFPSGHSQAAFSAATFLALYFRRYRFLLYGAAFMVALSRVYLGTHFPLDIVVGSLLGWLVPYVIFRLDSKSPRNSPANFAETVI